MRWRDRESNTVRAYDNFLVDDMLAARTLADEVGGDPHDNDSTSPLKSPDEEHQRSSKSLRNHLGYTIICRSTM
jgi:hypothetical protein